MKTTLVIFTLNEIEASHAMFSRIPFDNVDEAFVIDGNSTDGTIEFFRENNIPVYLQDKPGHGEAYKLGLEKATGEILIFFGCDGNNRPENIPALIEKMEKGYDLVIATRFGKSSKSHDATLLRKFGNWLFAFAVNVRWGARLTDVFDEFRAIKKESMQKLELENSYFDLELEMIIKALKHNFKITEIPTIEEERKGGEAKLMTFRDGWMNFKCYVREFFRK